MNRRVAHGAACAALLLCAGTADANRSGITHRAQIGCGGGGCHAGGAQPNVELIGPGALAPGEAADFTVRISGGQSAAGANVESTAGLLVPGEGLAARGGQLVHAGDARTYTDGAAVFTFSFEAPDTPGTVELFAAGNSVDNNFQATGDQWALASTTIVVGNGVAPDGGVDPDAGDGGNGGGDSGCRQQPGAPSGGGLVFALLLGGGLLVRRSM